ncbi:MAG: MMPL family transporter [Nocardioides sp.]
MRDPRRSVHAPAIEPVEPPARRAVDNRLISLIVTPGRSWLIALVMAAIGTALLVGLGQAERVAGPTDSLPDDADSTTVAALSEELPEASGSSAIVVFSVEDSAAAKLDQRTVETLDRLVADLAPGGLVVSEDGTAAFGVVPVRENGAEEIAEVVDEVRATVDDVPDGITAQVTGPAGIQADLAAVFEGADVRLLASTAGVVALLLLITYRSPLLWIVPLSVVGLADQVAAVLATRVLRAFDMSWDESTVGILSVLVFGAGTDYALLLISRYRDELKVFENRYDAMRTALRGTAEAVISSSTTVFVGLLTLLLSLFASNRSLGLACAVGVGVAAVFVLTLLPAFLVLFGRWIFWPLTPRVGQPTLTESRSLWRRIGEAVSRRPGLFVIGTVVLLAALSAGVTQIRSGLSQSDQFLEKPEAIAGAERLAESFPAGAADPAIVLTRADLATAVASTAQKVDGVSAAQVTARGNGLARIDVPLTAEPGSAEEREGIAALRSGLAEYDDTYVGGTAALAIDADAAAERDRLLLIPAILALVLIALMLLLRSFVAPLILVATVVGTYFASLGLAWWLFTGVFGFERLDVGVPLLAFLFGVALGVDYNIFLVSRAAEEAAGRDAREGMLRGLTATGGVITSAGILLAAVFAVLGVLPLVVLAQLGAVICIGVLLDTLVVRTVLVPAIAIKMGEKFWWPRRVSGPA